MKYFFVLLFFLFSLHAEESNFAALVVDGEEKEFIFFYKKGKEFYVEITLLSQLPDITIDPEHNKIVTPIGDVVLAEVLKENENGYIRLLDIENTLKIESKYLEDEFLFSILTPWRHLKGRNTKEKKEIDIHPQSNVLNGVRLEVESTYQNSTFTHREELQVMGRTLDGMTKISTLQLNDNTPYINELYWLKTEKRYNILLGLQNTQAHQLLPFEQMTGIQAVWANYDLPDISNNTQATLRPSLGPDNRIIQGKGPIGGAVVLMINNKARISQRIRLDGTYRIDIGQENLSSSDMVELWIYERDPIGSPIRKHNLNYIRQATILKKGQLSILGGAGAQGNSFNPDNPENNNSVVANMYLRYGLTDKTTLEGGVMQDKSQRKYILFGATSTLTDNITLHASVSAQDSLFATFATVDGRWDKDLLSLRWQTEPKGYRGNVSNKKDGFVDYIKEINDRLSLGFNGQYHLNESKDIKFLLPTLRYRPIDNLALSVIPNYNGYYRYSSTYTPNPDLRLNYIYEEERHTLSIIDNITDEWNIYFDGSIDGKIDKDRYELGATWRAEEYNDLYFETGMIYSDNEVGAKLNMRHKIISGVYANYELRYEPYLDDKSKTYAFVNIIADYGIVNNKVIPTRAPMGQRNMRGYIAGNVYLQGTTKNIDAEDIQLMINHSEVKAGVNAKGKFFVENLKAGIYTVKLDASSLPMEYTPVQSSYTVKVANGTVSEVDFYVNVFYGIAGKLHRKNSKGPVEVVLKSTEENKEYLANTDTFDYYRFDGIPPGKYRLTVNDENIKVSPLTVIIKDDFLFDQNLYVRSQ